MMRAEFYWGDTLRMAGKSHASPKPIALKIETEHRDDCKVLSFAGASSAKGWQDAAARKRKVPSRVN